MYIYACVYVCACINKSKNNIWIGLVVMEKDRKKPFKAKCWPDESVWLDYLNPLTREYWASLYGLQSYKGTTAKTFVWNDMNEPSVFDSFENTCEKNLM